MRFYHFLSWLCLSASLVFAQNPGTIEKPAAGTYIAPGSSFEFKYNIMADYSVSTYNFSVYLITQPPDNLTSASTWAAGHYFGRFDEANYPAVPYAQNPAPANLTMPDFSLSQGGWGTGESVTNATFYLVVLEEWADGVPSVGNRISLATTPIIYNATSP